MTKKIFAAGRKFMAREPLLTRTLGSVILAVFARGVLEVDMDAVLALLAGSGVVLTGRAVVTPVADPKL